MAPMTDHNAAPARFKDLALDAVDHQTLADWWCAALGYRRSPADEGEVRPREWPVPIEDPSGHGPLIWINPVPEKKTLKNRMHLDVWGDPDRLVELNSLPSGSASTCHAISWSRARTKVAPVTGGVPSPPCRGRTPPRLVRSPRSSPATPR